MNNNFLFFFVGSIVLILSIAVLYVAPIINGFGSEWKFLNCLGKSDEIDIFADTAASVDINDYTEFRLLLDKPAIVYRIQLEAGKTYYFQHVSSAYFYRKS